MCKVLLMSVVALSISFTKGIPHKQTKVCSFRHGMKQIDLSPLASWNGSPTFTERVTTHGLSQVWWNPCSPVSESSCVDAAICGREIQGEVTKVASQSTAGFTIQDNKLFIQYSTVNNRKISILLACSEEEAYTRIDKAEVEKMDSYLMTLYSKYCCWNDLVSENPSVSNITSNVTVPTFPTPGVATASAAPSDTKALTFLLLIEVLATILILLVLLSGLFVFLNWKVQQRRAPSPPAYQHIAMYDDPTIKL